MKAIMRLHSLVNGPKTVHDGRWLVTYDPRKAMWPYRITLITTTDPAKARRFASKADAWECWRQAIGIRPTDGQPDRPLTAWSVEITDVPEIEEVHLP